MGLCEVRERMLSDHRRLRSRMNEIDALAITVATGNATLFPFLCVKGLDLLEALETQLCWQEQNVLPVVREFYGAERAELTAREQRARRDLLRFELEEITDRTIPPVRIACGLLDLATIVREELDQVEGLFFDPDLLRDENLFSELESA